MVVANHLTNSLRVLNSAGKGIRSFSGVRRDLSAGNVSDLLDGINEVSAKPATNAHLTIRSELVVQP